MKKNILTKLGGLFLGLAMGLGVAVGVTAGHEVKEAKADSASFKLTSEGSVTVSGVTASFAIGSGTNAPKWYDAGLRLYTGNTFTLSSSNTITGVSINWEKQGSKAFAPATAAVGSYTHPSAAGTGTWTGSAKEIVFTVSGSGQLQLNTFSVTYTAGGTPTTNYTVTFDVQDHGTAPQAATVASGGKVTKPTDPSASGYTFGGWYRETGCTNEYDFNTAVTSSFTLYAKWTENGGGGGTSTSSDYTLVKSASNLLANDKVVIAIAGANGPATGVTGMNTNNKDATVSATPADWVQYTVTLSDSGFTLKDGNSYINFAEKAIKYGDASVLNVTSDGYICLNSTQTMILFNQTTFYRPYNGKLGTNGYTPFSVYKVGAVEDVDLTGISLQSTAEVVVGSVVELVPVKTPSNANKKTTLTWESLNPAVASVSDGKVTGLSVGTAQIRVNATDIGKSAVCTVTVNPVPPVPVTHTIADCYSVSTGTNVKFNGVYMGTYGNNPYQGIFFADGQYGIIIYKTSSVPESWEVGKTVIAVTGKTAFYNGLVQVTDASFEATSATVADPVPYTFLGTETTGNALSRKSSISGTVTSVTGQTNNAFVSGTDGKVTVDLGDGKTAMIFIKKGVHSAQELADYTNKFIVGAYVVVTGFLNYYDNSTTFQGTYKPGSFQIIVPTIVSTKVYDADAFAADFLNDTDAICSIEKDDHGTELSAVWADIGAKFTALNDTEKAKVVVADAAAQTDLGKAVARYDYLVAKYSLTNFIDGRTPSPARVSGYINNQNDNTATIIIAVVSVLSLATLCTLIVIKRRKSIEK